jgi:hypothetical protein
MTDQSQNLVQKPQKRLVDEESKPFGGHTVVSIKKAIFK